MAQTIVVVDDEPDVLEYLELLLSLHGLQVVSSDYSGDVAGLIAQTQPALVLLDLQNGLDRHAGLVILTTLRADSVTARLPVVLMTADHNASGQRTHLLRELGATLLLKPFEPDHLLEMIEQITV